MSQTACLYSQPNLTCKWMYLHQLQHYFFSHSVPSARPPGKCFHSTLAWVEIAAESSRGLERIKSNKKMFKTALAKAASSGERVISCDYCVMFPRCPWSVQNSQCWQKVVHLAMWQTVLLFKVARARESPKLLTGESNCSIPWWICLSIRKWISEE